MFIGMYGGLKIRLGQLSEGSNPSSGTTIPLLREC